MLAIAIGLLLTVAVAVCIVMVVALPYLRNGSRILTPDGERKVERVREQAMQKPVAAAGTTWSGLVAAREKAAKAWEPASAALHERLDRLESAHTDGGPARHDAAAPDRPRDIRPVEGRPEPEGLPVAPVVRPGTRPAAAAAPATQPMRVTKAQPPKVKPARPVIGGQRPVPPISGPIPVEAPSSAGDGVVDPAGQVIDLREAEPDRAAARDRSRPAR